MDSKAIRKENLRSLIREFGSAKEVANRSGLSEYYLSQILTDVKLPSGKIRGVGDDAARALEKGCQKPPGWLDKQFTSINMAILADIIWQLESYQERTGLKITAENKARYIALAYDRANEGDDFKLNELSVHLIAG